MCVQYAFASEKCLNIFWWEDNRGVVHWFRDNDWKPVPVKSDPVIDEFNVPKSLYVKSDFLPIRAIGHSDSNSHPDCNADEVIVEDNYDSKIMIIPEVEVKHHIDTEDILGREITAGGISSPNIKTISESRFMLIVLS